MYNLVETRIEYKSQDIASIYELSYFCIGH